MNRMRRDYFLTSKRIRLPAAILGLLVGIVLGSRPAEAQYSADFQTNVISGVASNWGGYYYVGDTNYYVGDTNFADVLVITNNGVLSSGGGRLGNADSSSNNSVLVSGSGSVWTNTAQVRVGNSGSGNSLVISNGGEVVILGAGVVGSAATSSNNSVLVSGSGSVWTNTSEVDIGSLGIGNSLVISSSGTVFNSDGYIGKSSGSDNNSVLVTGNGSVWTNTGNLNVGYDGSGNSLVISNSGTVFDSEGWIGVGADSNSVLITGSGSVWNNSIDLYVGYFNSGNSLVISDGGTAFSAYDGAIGYGATSSSNSVLVTGSGSVWTDTGDFKVGYAGSGNSLVISNGGTLVSSNLFVGYNSSSSNNLVTLNGGNLTVANGLTNGVLDVRQGTFTMNGGTNTVDQFAATNGVSSIVSFNGGALITKSTTVSNGAAFVVGNGTNSATLALANGGTGVHSFNNGLVISSNATLNGVGTVLGATTMAGTLSPGFSVGTITISNDLVLSSSSVLQYELGSNSDLTVVSSNLTLDGTINITDAGGFTNGTYTIFTYGGTLTDNGLTIGTTPDSSLCYTINTNTLGTVSLTVNALPLTSAITGTNSVCAGQAGVTYSVTTTSGSSYAWTVPTGASITAGAGTAAITVTFGSTSGNVTVTETNAAGCAGTQVSKTVTVNALSTSAITGTNSVCASQAGVTYSVTTTSGSSYAWAVPTGASITAGAGTAAITVTFGSISGNVTVTETNAAGCAGTQVSKTVTVNALPSTSAITGTNSVCASQAGVTYSVTTTSGSSYAWTVPTGASITAGAGTAAITVTFGSTSGNVTVTETDAAGCAGTQVLKTVTVNALPSTSAITGTNSVSASQAGVTYSVTTTSGSSYAWTVPTGASITAGAGTAAITVTFGSTSGNVTVTETNAAGCAGTQVLKTVTVNSVNPSPSAIFSGTPTNGTAPLAVTFTDSSTGTISNRLWNFGDGSTTNFAVSTNPVHTYNAGTYTVTLIVSGSVGSSTNIRTSYIVATNLAPAAIFSGTPTNGTAPLAVTFTDSSTGTISNRLWNFGDGSVASFSVSTNPVHTYNAGTYTVTLIVSGSVGSSTNIRTSYIVATNAAPDTTPPLLTVLSPVNYQTFTNAATTVTGTASDASGIRSVTVSGGSASVLGTNWSAAFTLVSGTNTITVIATDNSANMNTATQVVHAILNPVVTPTNHPPQITAGLSVTNALLQIGTNAVVVADETNTFTVSATDADHDTLNYQWVFGDGASSNTAIGTVEHVYTNDCGPYHASVTVSDGHALTNSDLTVVVACQMQITKLQLNLNFAKTNADSCTVKGRFELPASYSFTNKLATLDIGGAEVSFTLPKKGSGHNGSRTFSKPTYNKKTGLWTFSATLKKGFWQTPWAEFSMINSNIPRPGVSVTNFPVILVLDTEAFMGTTNLNYTAKQGKSGTAK